jgi:hypothetical protein
MEEFLKKLQISDNAMKLYLQSVGRKPLSSFELYSILPNISQEEYAKSLNELIDAGLLIPVNPQSPDYLLQYLTVPPIKPIIAYYGNINANLDGIKNQIHQLLSNSLKKIFQDNTVIELDTTFNATQELRKDFEEDVIIQKQDIDDVVQGMENLKIIKNVLDELHKTIKGVTQNQFSYLIKLITTIKKDLNIKIESLELKKSEKAIKSVIEDVFQENFEKILEDFTVNLHKLIKDEFDNTIESLNNIIDSTFQFRDDFQMLLLNMLNSYESKINKTIELVKKKRNNLSSNLKEFENVIIDSFNAIISSSVDSVVSLNEPINKAMISFYKIITSSEKVKLDNFWHINSVSRVNEEILSKITHVKENLLLVVPKLEDHLSLEEFKDIPGTLKIKIASSEAHTNSNVKQFKEIKNLEYRTLKNESVIVIKSDDNYVLMGIIQKNSPDSLKDFVGFATDYTPLIELILSVISTVWDKASSSLHEKPRSLGIMSTPREATTSKTIGATRPITPSSFKASQTGISQTQDIVTELTQKIQDKVKETSQQKALKLTPKTSKQALKASKQIPKASKQAPKTSKQIPKAGDDVGMLIDTAFKSLVQKLQNISGEEFSTELENIADLILEKKGFSVTLHKLRSKINQYKTHLGHLSEVDINHIVESIEEWKKHLIN